ncbi:HDOD domain protein [Pirellulimonas nuda]|uniref:HDOD domain protein n=1 Tax=Pirellulimonas nuda TaxID=2528009 RepID=A0A518DJ80_9BACT|nr:HDOD domain-containing protein [Pirellulimonas nuda]QDU91544.1 HDOD domain protein [Pirellulimonas nuda]
MAQERAEPANPRLNAILSVATIPAMPDCAMRVLALSNDPNKDAIDLAKPIEADAGMAAQLLRFVNSSYFGFQQKIGSVPQAVSLLGISRITNFVMWNAVFAVIPDPNSRAFSMTVFRCDALRRGLLARAIARRLEPAAAEAAFTAGLLQDIAVPVLVRHFGDAYLALIQRSEAEGVALSQLESDTYGWTHAEAAGQLLVRWGLPEPIAAQVRTHSDPEALLATPGASSAALAVAVASLLPSFRQSEWQACARFQGCWDRLPLAQPSSPAACLVEVDEAFTDLARALSVRSNGPSLVALYTEALSPCASR